MMMMMMAILGDKCRRVVRQPIVRTRPATRLNLNLIDISTSLFFIGFQYLVS